MSVLILVAVLFAILLLSWTIWFLIERARYNIKYEDEVDERLRSISR